jgi:hypothetical protein
MITAQRVDLAFEDSGPEMASWVGQVRFALPVLPALNRETPVITGIRIAISQVSSEVMQSVFDDRQATPCTRFWQRRSGCPAIRSDVVLPHFIGDGPWVFPLETAREPDVVSVDGRVKVRDAHRHIFLPAPGVRRRIVDIDPVRSIQIIGKSAKQVKIALYHGRW